MKRRTVSQGLSVVAAVLAVLVILGQAPPPPAPAPSVAAPAPTQVPAPSPTPPAGSPAPLPAPEVGLYHTLLVAGVQEIPKLITTVISALVAIGLAWYVGLRIAAAWDMRKKRGEYDILLAQEFYTLVASFKAVSREWESHLKRKPASDSRDFNRMMVWETTRVDLARRALDAETNMESILLKLLTEGMGREGLTEAEGTRRRRSLSLFRVAFRNLREMVEEGQCSPPGWGHPEFWLFNRLAGEISRIVYERSVQVPNEAKAPAQPVNAVDYLRLLAGRTTDLRVAARRLQPRVEAFFRQRAEDRWAERRANVECLLNAEQFMFVDLLPLLPAEGEPPPPLAAVPAVAPVVRAAVEVMRERRDITHARDVADALFGAYAALSHYVVLCNEPARVLVLEHAGEPKIFEELNKLTVQLPWSDPTVEVLGADLLAWQLRANGHARLAEIAAVNL